MALVGISGPRSVNSMGGLGGEEEEKKWPDSGEDFACFFYHVFKMDFAFRYCCCCCFCELFLVISVVICVIFGEEIKDLIL